MAASDASPVSATQIFGHSRMLFGEAFDVQLINNGFVPSVSDRRREVAEGLFATRAMWCEWRGIAFGVEDRIVPAQIARDELCVRIEQNLARIEPVPARGIVWAVHAKAINLPGFTSGRRPCQT